MKQVPEWNSCRASLHNSRNRRPTWFSRLGKNWWRSVLKIWKKSVFQLISPNLVRSDSAFKFGFGHTWPLQAEHRVFSPARSKGDRCTASSCSLHLRSSCTVLLLLIPLLLLFIHLSFSCTIGWGWTPGSLSPSALPANCPDVRAQLCLVAPSQSGFCIPDGSQTLQTSAALTVQGCSAAWDTRWSEHLQDASNSNAVILKMTWTFQVS